MQNGPIELLQRLIAILSNTALKFCTTMTSVLRLAYEVRKAVQS